MNSSFLNAGVDDKKRFEILLEGLKDAYKELIDTALKLSTVLLAVLAWFVSSKNPLGMLCTMRPLSYVALVFTVAGWLMLIYLFNILYQRADQSYQLLLISRYDPALFSRYRVTRNMFLCSVFGHFTMLLGIFCSILVRYIWYADITCKT